MSSFLLILAVFLIMGAGVGIVVFYIRSIMDWIKKDIEGTRFEIQKNLQNVSTAYGEVQKELGVVQEIGRGMKNLQEYFRSPKHRGNIGEQILEDYLEKILPKNSFKKQYSFSEGNIVDFVIITNQGKIPIDSKFSVESFNRLCNAENNEEKESLKKDFARDVKRKVDEIAKKYILPQEGTVDFAVMYVPSEPIYYEILSDHPEITDYANDRKVYLISPKTLYYFLKTIMMSMQGAKIEETAKKILRGIQGVKQETEKLGEEFDVLNSHLERAKMAAGRTHNRFEKLTGKVENLTSLEALDETKKLS